MTRRTLYHLLWILLPILLLPDLVVAQQSRSETDSRRREELVKQRKEFFAQELGLTADEATYLDRTLREADKKRIPLWRELREQYELTKSETLSEAQATKCLQREQQIKLQLAEIDEQTMTKLRKQIPARKLVNYQQVQREFARKYIKRSQSYRSDRR
ncbi:hypothetical protein [Porphyromonas uenonis]|uniref:hypothetical protein n=1 Tax=Porphyromonas uenonis TaxID=281920 RepID=UPI0004705DDB|nr:hypothetical protein [Porphyromonas uenonis]